MSSNGTSEVTTHGAVEDSETTIEIKIKTLDSQTYTLRVNKRVPVPLLKEKIANVTGIVSEQQRLICRGKVLKDDELLSAYHVEDGHTLHLVVRQPQQSSLPLSGYMLHEGSSSHPATNVSTSAAPRHSNRSIVFEAVNMDQGARDIPNLGLIISSILNSIGTANVSSDNLRNDAMSTRTSDDTGPSNSTQTNLAPASVRVEVDSQQVPFLVQAESTLGSLQPTTIPDSMTTILHYLEFMKDEFRRAGFDSNGRARTDNDVQTARRHSNEMQNNDYQSRSAFRQGGLPSPVSLAEVLHSVRLLLTEQAGGCLSHLARLLEDHVNITDPLARMDLQSSAIRSGVLLENLGSLLLEVGRTTMMLRIGQAPSEALINAGPAVFISASGPNPLMVQPVPFFAGSSFGHMGAINSGHGLQAEPLGSVLRPRNIDIHIRTGRGTTVAHPIPGEQIGAQQVQEQTDTARESSGANLSHQTFSMLASTAPVIGESGVRVLPIRTVVAVPAGASRSSPDSGSGVGLIYPLLARVQQANALSARDEASQPREESSHGGPQTSQQSNLEPSRIAEDSGFFSAGVIHNDSYFPVNSQPAGPASIQVHESGQQGLPTTNSSNVNSQDHLGQQIGQDLMSQFLDTFSRLSGSIFSGDQPGITGTSHQDSVARSVADQIDTNGSAVSPEASGVSNDGVLFSNLVRQLMPFISQGTTVDNDGMRDYNYSSSQAMNLQTASENLNDSRANMNESTSSQHDRDQIEGPLPKRQRKSE